MYSAPRVALGQLGALKSLKIVHSPELRSLETCIVDLPSLESLYLRGCENLSSLPRARAGGPQEYSSLRELTIRRCPGVNRCLQLCSSDWTTASWINGSGFPSLSRYAPIFLSRNDSEMVVAMRNAAEPWCPRNTGSERQFQLLLCINLRD